MYITKTIDTTIDLLDPVEIYQHDVNSLVLKKLNERYVKKCYQSILITEIISIIRLSPIMMSDNRLDGSAYVDVQFEVGGVIFIEGEVLHNCKIIEIHSNAITAEHEYAGIKLRKNANDVLSKILTVGQHIPVVIEKFKYTPAQSSISMIGSPFIPMANDKQIIYYITSAMTEEDKEKMELLFNFIDKEEKLHPAITKQKQYAFFQDLLYPYKVNQKFEQNALVKKYNFQQVPIELKNMINMKNMYVVYSDKIPKQNKIFFTTEQKVNIELDIIEIDAFPLFASICNEYLLYLQALRGFVETYDTVSKLQALTTYWKICKNAKL